MLRDIFIYIIILIPQFVSLLITAGLYYQYLLHESSTHLSDTYIGPFSLVIFIIAVISPYIIVISVLFLIIMRSCYRNISYMVAILLLVIQSIFTGAFMAYFMIYSITTVSGLPRYVNTILTSITLLMMLLITIQMLFLFNFTSNGVGALGYHLDIIAIGISAMSMGMVLSILPSYINFSSIAGPIIGSGLTMIAVGMQRYHEVHERSRHGRRRPRLY